MIHALPLFVARLGAITWSITAALSVVVSVIGQAHPGSAQLAVLSGGSEIHLLDVERQIDRLIFRGPYYIFNFDWSPDGRRIAFVAHSLDDGGIHVYVLEIESSQLRRVTDASAAYISVAWSPDGRWLAFESDHEGDEEIYVVNNADCLDACEGGVRRITHDSLHRDFGPVWSPDGIRLVFVSALLNGRSEVRSTSIYGSNPFPLTYRLQPNGIPAWSPDGQKLIIPAIVGATHELYVMDTDCIPVDDQVGTGVAVRCERTLRNLTSHPDEDWYPVWSPDSQEIIFLSFRDGNSEIYRLNMDSGQTWQLTDNIAEESRPDWSPDGQWIAFVSDREGGYDIYVMDTDGENLRRLTYSGFSNLPVWRP